MLPYKPNYTTGEKWHMPGGRYLRLLLTVVSLRWGCGPQARHLVSEPVLGGDDESRRRLYPKFLP